MSHSRALNSLSNAFRGQLPVAGEDWIALIDHANRGLVTPRLFDALKRQGRISAIPEDALSFFGLIEGRNNKRNRKLRLMAEDAVSALNQKGVTPILLKGAAAWASCRPDAENYPRMMSDVDLMVRPREAEVALAALAERGFKLIKRYPDDLHILAELWRDGDVGILDLHLRPPGPQALAALFDPDLHTTPSRWAGDVLVPTPAHQIYLMCLHDLFHEGGFWRGRFDMRHLCDIADLAADQPGIDWKVLRSLVRTRLVRNAVFSQLVAAEKLAGATVPRHVTGKFIPRLHYYRHRGQHAHPKLGFWLALLGISLEAPNLRQYWPFLGADNLTPATLLWWLRQERPYPNRI